MDRSKSKLRLENMSAPYFIDYRVVDLDNWEADAALGGVRDENHTTNSLPAGAGETGRLQAGQFRALAARAPLKWFRSTAMSTLFVFRFGARPTKLTSRP